MSDAVLSSWESTLIKTDILRAHCSGAGTHRLLERGREDEPLCAMLAGAGARRAWDTPGLFNTLGRCLGLRKDELRSHIRRRRSDDGGSGVWRGVSWAE